jgi:lysophospholipase L1-like esterase
VPVSPLCGPSRARLFLENVATRKGELRTFTFVVNKRNPQIDGRERVKIKVREQSKLNWDDKLTLEFNGDAPVCSEEKIEKADDVPTIFLAGNSTVVDQDNEPWASWGQMIPRWFGDGICFANYAESGESANTFIAAGRLKKALTQMKAGDYMLIEFGHNDQKQHGPGKGAYYSFATSLKTFIDEVKAKGATPILVTPTQRRSFQNGKIMETHGDYPEAMRWVAQREGVALIDLHELTRTLFETFGEEGSLHAFVHYPAGTYPHQTVALADNTHFNPYGAYEIAKCVIEGMKANHLDGITKFLRPDYKPFSPSRPDNLKAFHWNDSPFTEVEKPDGN